MEMSLDSFPFQVYGYNFDDYLAQQMKFCILEFADSTSAATELGSSMVGKPCQIIVKQK